MSEKNGAPHNRMCRTTFIHRTLKAAAMIVGAATAARLASLGSSRRLSHAAVSEDSERRDSMNYRRLGKTNIMVSEISFGCALNYGCNLIGTQLNDIVQNLYAKALELGINVFDTSINSDRQYLDEESFRYFKPVRDKVYLATKVNDFDPKATRASIEKSLSRMKTDYIDIVFLHNMWRRGGWDKAVPALEEMRKIIDEGKVRFTGVSDHSYINLMKVGKYAHLVDVILLKYSIKKITRAEAVISEADSLDIGTIAIKVFEGAYECWADKASKWQHDSNLQPYLSNNTTVAQAAVRFVLNNTKLSSALIGMRSEAEILDNITASYQADTTLSGCSDTTASRIFRNIYKLINISYPL
jgi:aryl-alcohol dehydrogenase-like predicted oxidoreductase